MELNRLESRVASSRRILALAKRREDVGHRLKLFESGDEERRNSGVGVQLQVRPKRLQCCVPFVSLFVFSQSFLFLNMRQFDSVAIIYLDASSFAGRAAAKNSSEGVAPHHRRAAHVARAGLHPHALAPIDARLF